MSLGELKTRLVRSAGFYRGTYRIHYPQGSAANKGPFNFGDMLSRYIVEQITGRKIPATDKRDPYKLLTVGSLISNQVLHSGGVFWGTGMHCGQIDYAEPRFPTKFCAVRGPLTRKWLVNAGYECPAVFGDPALLLPEFYRPGVSKKYKLGCVPHMIHAGLLSCSENVKKINMGMAHNSDGEIMRVIDEINECETIVSSSLHGVIVANAYGIPARYMAVRGAPLLGAAGFKFSDYFQSVSMPDQDPLFVTAGQTITEDYLRGMSYAVDLRINLKLLRDSFPYDLPFG